MKKLCLLAAVVTWLLIPPVSAAELPQAGQPAGATGVSAHGEAGAALKQDLRKLWTDHVVWTRDYVIAALGDQPDAQAAANRLLKNQEDIGKAVAKFTRTPPGSNSRRC